MAFVITGEPGYCLTDEDCPPGYICVHESPGICIISDPEKNCWDRFDNDNDGLIDYEDPDCEGVPIPEFSTYGTILALLIISVGIFFVIRKRKS